MKFSIQAYGEEIPTEAIAAVIGFVRLHGAEGTEFIAELETWDDSSWVINIEWGSLDGSDSRGWAEASICSDGRVDARAKTLKTMSADRRNGRHLDPSLHLRYRRGLGDRPKPWAWFAKFVNQWAMVEERA